MNANKDVIARQHPKRGRSNPKPRLLRPRQKAWRVLAMTALFLIICFSPQLFAFEEKQEEFFSTKGTVTQIDSEGGTLRLKSEQGLELTFRLEEGAQISQNLQVGNTAELQYVYNDNYEKVVKAVSP